jgi:hypothetical protein
VGDLKGAEKTPAKGRIAVNDQVEATGKQLAGVAENALVQTRERASRAAKKGAQKGEHAIERAIDATRERGSDALLSALATEPGKRLAGTPAGTALKSKLTARKRRRKKILLLLIVNAGGVVAIKQVRARRAAFDADASGTSGNGAPFPTEGIDAGEKAAPKA